jgi:hypothetical protein
VQTRTGAYEARTGQYREDTPLSLFLTIRRYPDPDKPFDFLKSFDVQRRVGEDLMERHVVPKLARPIAEVISANPE